MIVRNINGELIKINKYDCSNDMVYYEKIMNIKKEFTKDYYFENKTIKFFSPKKTDKSVSSTLHTICDFVNIKL